MSDLWLSNMKISVAVTQVSRYCCYTGLQILLLHRAPDIVVTQGSRYCCYTELQISFYFVFASCIFFNLFLYENEGT